MADLRVLVVDDDELILRVMLDFFRQRKDDCQVAPNATVALRLVEDRIFDIMLTDISMPGMDGIELIKRVKLLQPQMTCILMSGVGTRRDIISALKTGVFDFVDKPIPDLGAFTMLIDRAGEANRLVRERDALLESLRRQNAKLEFSLLRLHEAFGQMRQQEEALEADLLKAQRVQLKFLPKAFPHIPELDLFGYFGPCEQLGGDFFGAINLNHGRIALYLVDVAGHGVSAAMITVTFRELMRALQRREDSASFLAAPDKVLAHLNDALSEEAFDPPILMTMVYAVMDPASGRAQVASAAHPAPLKVSAQGPVEAVAVSGPILGAKLPNTFSTVEVRLAVGESLVFYSDGVTETANPTGQDFSIERLKELLAGQYARPAKEMGSALERAMQNYLEGFSPADDITFIVASRRAPAAEELAAPSDGSAPESVKTVLPRKLQRVRSDARGRVRAGWRGKTCVVRFTGVITWQVAPTLREITRLAKTEGAERLQVDLSECEAMDSTVLGLLFQLSNEAVLHQPGSRVISQLHDMGVLERFAISHAPAETTDREILIAPNETREACSELILSAHQALMEASESNQLRFKDVVSSLEQKQRADSGSGAS